MAPMPITVNDHRHPPFISEKITPKKIINKKLTPQ